MKIFAVVIAQSSGFFSQTSQRVFHSRKSLSCWEGRVVAEERLGDTC